MTLSVGGDSIEGEKVAGQSRHPLPHARGLTKVNGVVCYQFDADFDVRARVVEPPDPEAVRLNPAASTSPADEVVCARAIIHSIKNRFTQSVEHGSATHKTNQWRFPRQCLVTVDRVHEEIARAQEKRALSAALALLGG